MELYINDKRVDISTDTYFPFTIQPEDLENPTSIGIASSKTITLPFTKTNDEIFGYICDWRRKTESFSDYKISVNFNQLKKTKYKTVDGNVNITKGYLTLERVTQNGYEIILYDEIINYFDILQSKNLNDLEVYDASGNVWNTRVYENTVSGLTTPIVPVYNIKEQNGSKSKLRCTKYDGSTYIMSNEDLPMDCTELQLRSVRCESVDYGISLNNVIKSINNGITPTNMIEVDSSLSSLFNDVHILSNTLINSTENFNSTVDEKTITAYSATNSHYTKYHTDLIELSTIFSENKHIYVELNADLKITCLQSPHQFLSRYSLDGTTFVTVADTAADGTFLGDMTIWAELQYMNNTTLVAKTKPIKYTLKMYKNVNTFITYSGANISYINIIYKLPLIFDSFPRIKEIPNLKVNLHLTVVDYESEYNLNYVGGAITRFFGSTVGSWYLISVQKMLNTTSFSTTNMDFRSGDLISGKNLYPKLSARDFLISVAKYFNLDMSIVDDKLILKPKQYYLTKETLAISDVKEVNVALVTFDKIKYNTGVPSDTYYDTYLTNTKSVYGEKTINTGYSIKENIKTNTFNCSIPALMSSTNNFAYDRFNNYYNGGYSYYNYGNCIGFNDKIVFGFLNTITETLHLDSDDYFDANFYTTVEPIPQDIEFNNKFLGIVHNTITDTWLYNATYNTSTILSTYKTFTAYRFTDKVVNFSLDMYKPKYTAAGLTDANYADSTTIYNRCHKKMLEDKFNNDSHIVKCNIYINGWVNIYKIYNYKNSLYIISNIVEYNPLKEGMYEVELLRVNDSTNYINAINLT